MARFRRDSGLPGGDDQAGVLDGGDQSGGGLGKTLRHWQTRHLEILTCSVGSLNGSPGAESKDPEVGEGETDRSLYFW